MKQMKANSAWLLYINPWTTSTRLVKDSTSSRQNKPGTTAQSTNTTAGKLKACARSTGVSLKVTFGVTCWDRKHRARPRPRLWRGDHSEDAPPANPAWVLLSDVLINQFYFSHSRVQHPLRALQQRYSSQPVSIQDDVSRYRNCFK